MELDSRTIGDELRRSVLRRDGYQCRYCGSKQEPFHLDHVYPYSKGGETTYENLVTACSGCNCGKNASVGMWPKPIGYFNNRNKNTMYVLIVAFLGVAAMVNGAIASNDGFQSFGRVMFIAGIALSILSIGYLMTKRWE